VPSRLDVRGLAFPQVEETHELDPGTLDDAEA